MMNKKIKRGIGITGFVLTFAVVATLNGVCASYSDVLNQWASITNVDVDDEELSDLMDNGKSIAEDIESEGAVLTQNKNNVLPLDKDSVSKVNVFGWGSTQWVYGGSGSGQVVTEEQDLIGALNDYGIETNTELTSMYSDFLDNRPYFDTGTLHSYASQFSVLYEPNIDDTRYYSDDILEDAEAFSDTAIVVLTRVSGESNDSPKEQYYSNTKNGANIKTDSERTYLDISQDEEDLLNYVSNTYTNTIVLVNSTNMMNLEFVERYPNIDSCLFVGATGESAANVIPELLYGDINPSGRFTDTYPYDLKSIPSYANSGPDEINGEWGIYTDSSGYYPADGTTNGNTGDNSTYPGVAYVDYSEDIYVGYKYFETADAEGYFDDVDNQYGQGYDGVVQYPFGYGLSYTTFEQKIAGLSKTRNSNVTDSDEITIDVSVENTGDVAGQDVVQLYLTRPYTENGIEKPEVELVDFGKTLTLEPGETETVELTVSVSDFASYDCYDKNNNGFAGYEIEEGEYQLKVMQNSHNLIDDNDAVITYKVASDIQLTEDPISGNTVENRFLDTSSDGISIDGSNSGQDITYMSRSDFEGTFPSEASANREMSQALKDTNLYTAQDALDFIDEDDEDITTGADNGLKVYEDGEITDLGLELGADFDNEQWDDVLDELTMDELMNSTLHGYVHNEELDSIGKPYTVEVDGPSQIGSFNVSKSGVGYPNATVLAQTFSKDLSYKFGKQVAKEALYCGYDGWYAPGCNLHRSPFGGRNYEYYSEDAYLSGIMAAYTIKGSLNIGVYVYLKHFIAYEQETYRDGLYTWLTEQNLRENYLKPFKIAVQVGGCTGIMTSYNRLGATWTSGNIDLITGVLYGEWGYKGSVITDYADHHEYMNMDQALRAGTTLYMDGYLNNGTYQYETSSNTFKQKLREAAKRNIYTFLNAKYQAKVYYELGDDQFAPVHKGESIQYWKYILGGVDAIAVIGLGTWSYFLFFKKKKVKKQG